MAPEEPGANLLGFARVQPVPCRCESGQLFRFFHKLFFTPSEPPNFSASWYLVEVELFSYRIDIFLLFSLRFSETFHVRERRLYAKCLNMTYVIICFRYCPKPSRSLASIEQEFPNKRCAFWVTPASITITLLPEQCDPRRREAVRESNYYLSPSSLKCFL